MNHVARPLSLWWDRVDTSTTRRRDPLDGDTRADVVIVGGGFTGLWTAYYLLLRQPDLDVVLVEREVLGFGASGRNGGWCSALFPASLDAMARGSTRADAVRMQRAMHGTVDEVGEVARREGIDVDWAKGGTITAARSAVQLARLCDEVRQWRQWGFGEDDYRMADAGEALALVTMTDLQGALVTPHCAAIDPLRLVRGLASAVESRGTRIHEATAATAIEPGAVRTERGTVRAPFVVRATEGYTSELPGLARAIVPVYSLMIATEPLPAAVWQEIGLGERQTFADARHLIIYGQRTADGRLAFGGRGAPYHAGSRVSPEFDLESRVHRNLWATLVDLLPQVRAAAVTHAWGGPLGIARDWHASCGLDRATGVAWAGGYVGDGVGTSNLAGRTLADLILGIGTDLVSLPWVGHRSPGWEPEPLRWLGINAGLRAMTAADRAEARTGRPSRRARLMARLTGG